MTVSNIDSFQKRIFFSKADLKLHHAKNIVTKAQINKIFQNSFKQKPLQIEKLGRSSLHNVFRVKAGNKDYLLRVNLLSDLYKEVGLVAEESISLTLKKRNLPSMHVRLVDISRNIVPFDFEITDYVKGEILYDMSMKKDIMRHINSLGSTLARIHSIKTSGFGPFDTVLHPSKNKLEGIYPKWPDYFFKNLKEHLRFLKKAKVIVPQTHKQITKIFDKYKSRIKCSSPRLLHGDVANHNAILCSGKIVLVDWEDAISGDPLYDVAFYITGVYKNDEWLTAFLSGYKKVSKNPLNFNLIFWLYFLRIALVKAIIRHRSPSTKETLPDYKERIAFAVDKIQEGNTNAVITGGAGFVGSHLVEKLVKQGFRVYLLVKPATDLWRIKEFLGRVKLYNVDLTNKNKLNNIVKKIKPDYVFHLATRGAYPTQQDPHDMIETNLMGTMNLLSALENIDYKNLVIAGSSSEYGIKAKPMKETDLLEPNNYYGVVKAAQSLIASSWSKVHNKPCVILRFFAVFGPKEEKGRLVRSVIEAALGGQPIKLASGKEARDFIYAADIVDACLLAISKVKARGEIYNVGSGYQSTIKQLAEAVILLTQSKSKILLNAYTGRPWDSYTWVADMAKTKNQLKFEARHTLLSGLKKTIIWYKKVE